MSNPKGIFIIGGFVRDLLLGRKPSDVDYVVVGMTEQDFLDEYPEAKKKTGKAFPVYKINGEDYGFARREKSTGLKHADFKLEFGPNVTLQEDLARRDLTINAFAMCPETGEMYAPLGRGCMSDLKAKVLRHLAPFTEDPLRVVRLARFAAELPEFTIAPETMELGKKMGLLLQLEPAERIWAETARALTTRQPSKFFYTLKDLNCLSYWFKELHNLIGIPAGPIEHHSEADCFDHAMITLDKVAKQTHNPVTRWAAIVHDLGKAATPVDQWPKHHGHDKAGEELAYNLTKRLQAGNRFKKAGQMITTQHMRIHNLCEKRAGKGARTLMYLNRFPGGISEFFKVIRADGACRSMTIFAIYVAWCLKQIKLPVHLQNKGPASGEAMLNIRATYYKEYKKDVEIQINGDCALCVLHHKKQ